MNQEVLGRRIVQGLGIMAVAAALALVLFGWSQSGNKRAEAGFPPPGGLNFSISAGLVTKGSPNPPTPTPTPIIGAPACDSSNSGGLPSKCTFPLSGQFRLSFWLRSIPAGFMYQGYDATVTYTSGLTVNTSSMVMQGTGAWPECGVPAPFFGTNMLGPGCSVGVPPAPQSSSYTGVMWYVNFTCTSSNSIQTMTMVHGEGNTDIFDTNLIGHGEAPIGSTESITINCGTPPTPTFTPTSTRTPTSTATKTFTPTLTNTPSVTPTPTRTPTATPLPSNAPDVTITKTDSPDPADSGGNISYSLLVSNIGQSTATGVQAVDLLSPLVTFVSATSPGANCTYSPGINAVTCNLKAPLAFGESVKITIVVTAPLTGQDIRVPNIAAVAAANEPVFNRGNKADYEQTVVLAPRSDVTLDITDQPDPVTSEGKVVYNIAAINLGPLKATDVVIKHHLPTDAVFKPGASSPECVVPVGGPQPDPDIGEVDVICTLASVTDITNLQISVNMPRVKRDDNVVMLSYISAGNELFAQTGNNSELTDTIVLAPPADPAIQMTGPAMIKRVQKTSYTITITNVGASDAFNVVLSDLLPKTVVNNTSNRPTIQSISGATCTGPVAGKLTCVIPKLLGNCPAGQHSDPVTHHCVPGTPPNNTQVVITLNVRMPTTVQDVKLLFQASITADNDGNGNNNSASVSTMLQGCLDVNGDNVVRVDDIVKVVNAYGSHVGDPGYNVLYDFDGNGVVNVYDVSTIVNHYRQNCPK